MKTIITLALVLLVALTACAKEQPEKTVVTGQTFIQPEVIHGGSEEAYEPVTRTYEVRISADTDDGTASGEVEEENFFPATFTALKGDTVQLDFLLDEPRYITIEDYGVAEDIQTGVIEFVAEKEGSYTMLCLDCEGTPSARIVVQ